VSHPNLVQLYDLHSDGEDWLLTMELVEGVHFLEHVRPGGRAAPQDDPTPTASCDQGVAIEPTTSPLHVDRLREALGQLVEGLAALHAHRLVHRDLKPRNVRVEPGGRLVILDFGLAADVDRSGRHLHTGGNVLGTVPYMAPEQGADPPVSSPASDWSSVGVMLYQALTGRLPFSGGTLKVMQDKLTGEPPPPRALEPDVPADLDELCRRLLRRRPEDRPAAGEIQAALGRTPALVLPAEETALLGRREHLAALRRAYEDSRSRPVLVAVHGPSGIGKTALVRHFLDRLAGEPVVALAGRCYERESVPYKALDPLVDELGRHLQRLAPAEVEARLPRDVAPLLRVFPTLGRVGPVADAAARGTLPGEPHELRRRAFAALRELLGRIGDRGPLVLHLDTCNGATWTAPSRWPICSVGLTRRACCWLRRTAARTRPARACAPWTRRCGGPGRSTGASCPWPPWASRRRRSWSACCLGRTASGRSRSPASRAAIRTS
jgi:hypothetical protein